MQRKTLRVVPPTQPTPTSRMSEDDFKAPACSMVEAAEDLAEGDDLPAPLPTWGPGKV